MCPSNTTLSREDRQQAARAGSAFIFLAFRCDRPATPAVRCCLDRLDEVVLGRAEHLSARSEKLATGVRFALEVDDVWMSAAHAVLRRVLDSWSIEDAGSKNGTLVNGQRISRAVLHDGDLIEIGHTFLLFRSSLLAPPEARGVVWSSELHAAVPGFLTMLPELGSELSRVEAAAGSSVPIVVRGETGTGKEVVAAAIHALSGRAGPFVAVNCGALAPNLVESELFGYRKGAFSGAAEDRTGLVRTADRGTLFLDEVGDLPLPAQAALLRVLQECEVLPVGGTRPVKVDIRLVAATHRDLQAMVAQDRFRPDLLARLDGLTVDLPPLRERLVDLGLLTAALLRRHCGKNAGAVTISYDAARALFVYPWPANVRELERCLQAAVVLAAGGVVEPVHLARAVAAVLDAPRVPPHDDALLLALPEPERRQRDALLAVLRECGGNVTAAAKALGKARVQVQRWMKRYRIDRQAFRR
jgi:transcriptional regulator with AAA-type ATPase domain